MSEWEKTICGDVIIHTSHRCKAIKDQHQQEELKPAHLLLNKCCGFEECRHLLFSYKNYSTVQRFKPLTVKWGWFHAKFNRRNLNEINIWCEHTLAWQQQFLLLRNFMTLAVCLGSLSCCRINLEPIRRLLDGVA